MLVDFIVFKLKKDGTNKKSDGKKTWDELGYDIAEFQIPESHFYMRSNFLKQKSAEVGLQENKENVPQNVSKASSTPEKTPLEALEAQRNEEAKDKGYKDPAQIEPKKVADKDETPEEKEERMRKEEQEQITKIIERTKLMK